MKWCVIGAGGIADRRTIPAMLSDESTLPESRIAMVKSAVSRSLMPRNQIAMQSAAA